MLARTHAWNDFSEDCVLQQGQATLVLDKSKVDMVHKDRKHKLYPANFRLSVMFHERNLKLEALPSPPPHPDSFNYYINPPPDSFKRERVKGQCRRQPHHV